MKYISFKYWHDAVLHEKSMVTVVIYSMCLGVSLLVLTPEWKFNKSIVFYKFCDDLIPHMLEYRPMNKFILSMGVFVDILIRINIKVG